MYVINDERKNAEGYMDLTAYKAIKKLEEGERKMAFLKGEIYEYIISNGTVKYAVVVSDDERNNGVFISVIVLNDNGCGDNNVPIICHGQMYANCDCVSYGHISKFGNFVRATKEEEMEAINAGIIKNLGLKAYMPFEGDTEDKPFQDAEILARNRQIAELTEENRKLKEECAAARGCMNAAESASQDAVKLMTERDLYKAQYEMLLERLISR